MSYFKYLTLMNGENTHYAKTNPMSFIFLKKEKTKQNTLIETTSRHKSFANSVLLSLSVLRMLFQINYLMAHFVYLLLKEKKLRLQLTCHRSLKRLYNAGILWKQGLTKMDHYSKRDVSNATDLQNISTSMQVDGVQCETNVLIVPLKYSKTRSPIIAGIQKAIQSLINGVYWYPKYVLNARKKTKQTNMQKELQVSVAGQVGVENVLPHIRNNGN